MKEKKTSRACSVLPYYDYYYKLHAAQKDGLELFSIELIKNSLARTTIHSEHTKACQKKDIKKLSDNLLRSTLRNILTNFLEFILRNFLIFVHPAPDSPEVLINTR